MFSNNIFRFLSISFALLFVSHFVHGDSIENLSEQIVNKNASLAKVWPGFWGNSQSFAVYDNEGKVVLVTHGEVPPGYKKESDEFNFLYEGINESLKNSGGYEIDYDFGPFSATAVRAEQGSFNANTLFHEAFHGYQDKHFEKIRSPYASQKSITSELLALKHIEKHFLKYALLAEKAKQQNTLLAIYTALRRKRQAQETEELVSAQLATERKEGVANYVGIAMNAVLKSKDSGWVVKEISHYLDPTKQTSTITDSYVSWDGYGIGSAITYLILQKNPELCQDISNSKSPFEILSEMYKASLSESDYKTILEEQSYTKINRSMSKMLDGNKKLLKKYNRKKDFLLSIELDSDNLGTFSATSIINISKGNILVQSPINVSFVGPRVTGGFSRYWYLMIGLPNGRQRLEIALSGEPEIECNGINNRCTIEYGKLELELFGRHKMIEKDDEIRIIVE